MHERTSGNPPARRACLWAMRPQQALPMQGDHDSNHTWDGCAQVDASSRAPPGTGAIDARDHRGEQQYAAAARPDRLSAALTKPATACRLATLIAADARGTGTRWQQCRPAGHFIRRIVTGRWDRPAACGPRRCATTDVRTAQWHPDRAVDPADGGGIPDVRGPAWRRGTRDQAPGRASRPGYRVADVEHALAGLHQLRAMSIPDGQRLTQPQGLPAGLQARSRGGGPRVRPAARRTPGQFHPGRGRRPRSRNGHP